MVLKGQDRHELSCSACGAPLHELKQMPVPQQPRQTVLPAAKASGYRARPAKKRKSKKPKHWSKKLTSELFDVIEDIFD